MAIPKWAQEAIDEANRTRIKGIEGDVEYTFVSGRVGSWRMLPDGSTCFYTPIDYEALSRIKEQR